MMSGVFKTGSNSTVLQGINNAIWTTREASVPRKRSNNKMNAIWVTQTFLDRKRCRDAELNYKHYRT